MPDDEMIDSDIPQSGMPREWNAVYNALVALEMLARTAIPAVTGASSAAMESLADECHDRRVLLITFMQEDQRSAKRTINGTI